MPIRHLKTLRPFLPILLVGLFATEPASGRPQVVGLGDSIGEGVQSADATGETQPWSYVSLVSYMATGTAEIPYIRSWWFGTVGSTNLRERWFPSTHSNNLAVSGADVGSLLRERADASSPGEIDSETDLVLYPRMGSQIEIAEALAPELALCWIGNNDALSAVTSFDNLNATQMTPVAQFQADFTEIAQRLDAASVRVVFGNIPDVTDIAFLVDGPDLVRFIGSDLGLAPGSYTTIVAMLLIRVGILDGSILLSPDWVLDAGEIALIQQRIATFNSIIQSTADGLGLAVVDVNAAFKAFKATPPTFYGIPVTSDLLGGLFSLDGVHPSNTGHALLANGFIETTNAHYGLSIPTLSQPILEYIFLIDPSTDKDRDGLATGRPGQGALETLAPGLGIGGDTNDFDPAVPLSPESAAQVRALLDRVLDQRGVPPSSDAGRGPADYATAFGIVFGLDALR